MDVNYRVSAQEFSVDLAVGGGSVKPSAGGAVVAADLACEALEPVSPLQTQTLGRSLTGPRGTV